MTAPPDLVRAGREAFDRHAWTDAFDLLSRADAERPLSGAHLEVLGQAAFFAARGEERVDIQERAFKAYLDEGNRVRAAFHALGVAAESSLRGRVSIASAWARRAEPLLEGEPESYAHGFLALVQGDLAKSRGDLPAAIQRAVEAVEIAKRTGDPDLRATALTALGTLKVATGSASEGIGLLEEAAFSGVRRPAVAGYRLVSITQKRLPSGSARIT